MKRHCLIVLALGLLCRTVHAAPLAVGDALPVITATDQHGKPFTLTTNLQFLLVATERACAQAANRKLAKQGAEFLEKHQAAYLMDIHTMPSVARIFALPKMRKYPHRVVLVDSADTLTNFPTQPGRVTVLGLTSGGRIRKIDHWNPDDEPVAGYLE